MSFCGCLDTGHRLMLLSSLMPCDELVETYAPLFRAATCATAKPDHLGFGAQFIKQRLAWSMRRLSSRSSTMLACLCHITMIIYDL
jgi:hypothetical protein